MPPENHQEFIAGLQRAWQREQASARIYRALAEREQNEARRAVLLKLAATEEKHAERWASRLRELNAPLPPDRDPLRDRIWRWILVQSGTENAMKRIESTEDDDTVMYEALARIAPTAADRATITQVQRDEETHGRLASSAGSTTNPPIGPQQQLDIILHRESWHRRGGGWIGQAIYGANDGLGSVFGIVTGVAGATAGGPAVLIAGLAGMLASALSMGSGAYLATKADREVQEAELARERRTRGRGERAGGPPDRPARARPPDTGERGAWHLRTGVSESLDGGALGDTLDCGRRVHPDHPLFLHERLPRDHCIIHH